MERRDPEGRVLAGRYVPVDLRTDGQARNLGTLRISNDASLDGRVVANAAGVATALPGATVVIPGSPYAAVNGLEGFLLPALPPGRFELAAFFPGYAPAHRYDLLASAGTHLTASDLWLEAQVDTASVSVSGTAEAAEAPASGTLVRFRDALSDEAWIETRTDETASFRLELQPGLYHVQVEREGYLPLHVPNVAVLASGEALGLEPVWLVPVVPGDLDGDGIPDDLDPDLDNDGCPNPTDVAPRDPRFCADADGDGQPDSLQWDADGDGLSDAEELSPGLDGVLTNPSRGDSDADGIPDGEDDCPLDPAPDCEAGTGGVPNGPLRLESFSPTLGGEGERVVITGAGFIGASTPTVRFGGGLAAASEVRATELEVWVPAGATTAPIVVEANGQTQVFETAFQVVPRPVFADIHPQPAAPGVLLGLYLRGLDPDGGFEVGFDDREPSPAEACSAELEARATAGQTVVCASAPASASRVTVRVDGQAEARSPIVVRPGPQAVDVIPSTIAAGMVIRIIGQGLLADEADVQVYFPEVLEAVTPSHVGVHEIEVSVPEGVGPGRLRVSHPLGDFEVPVRLRVLPTAIAVSQARPAFLQAGRRTTLIGANLDQVTEVRLPDGSRVSVHTADPATLEFEVPERFVPTPGDLSLLTAAGPVPGSSFAVGAVRTATVAGANLFEPAGGGNDDFWGETREHLTQRMDAQGTRRTYENSQNEWSHIPETALYLGFQPAVPDGAVVDLIDPRSGTSLRSCVFPGTAWALATARGQLIILPSPDRSGATLVQTYDSSPHRVGQIARDGCNGFELTGIGRILGAGAANSVLWVQGDDQRWLLANVDPADAVADGTVVVGPHTVSGHRPRFGAIIERTGPSSLAGVAVDGPFVLDELRIYNRVVSSPLRPPQRVGARFAVLTTTSDCQVIEVASGREMISFAPPARSSALRCAGTGPRSLVMVRYQNADRFPNTYLNVGFELYELLEP